MVGSTTNLIMLSNSTLHIPPLVDCDQDFPMLLCNDPHLPRDLNSLLCKRLLVLYFHP